ncbi:Cytochrome oxidase assembly [Apophysomyces sp. BC1021]|nr:Cytochrome oxidase assembly [Apophysomyces sp. BC1021]
MPAFQSKPWDPLAAKAKKHPFMLFGLPFILTIVAGSFGLSQLTQTRYDHRDMKHKQVAKEEALGLEKNRRKLSLQEEYWRLQSKTEEDWESVRIERPPGTEE